MCTPSSSSLSDAQLPPGAELVFPSQYQPGKSMMYIKLPGQIKVQHEVGSQRLTASRRRRPMSDILGYFLRDSLCRGQLMTRIT